MRDVIIVCSVDDDKAMEEDMGTIEYLEREFGWLAESGIHLQNARILDYDDEEDAKAIVLANRIFKEE